MTTKYESLSTAIEWEATAQAFRDAQLPPDPDNVYGIENRRYTQIRAAQKRAVEIRTKSNKPLKP